MTTKGGNSWNVLSKMEALTYAVILLAVGMGLGWAIQRFLMP